MKRSGGTPKKSDLIEIFESRRSRENRERSEREGGDRPQTAPVFAEAEPSEAKQEATVRAEEEEKQEA